jgi:hypothetical protein
VSELPVPAPPAVKVAEIPPPQTLVCSNCGKSLSGEYCAACGQRHEPHIHSMAHFASEAFESITHADSRLWRTLGYLLAKPGRLTREFFDGRRATYLPPFRLYLVISVAFFLLGPSADSSVAIKDAETVELAVSDAIAKSAGTTAVDAAEDDGVSTIKVQGLSDFCREFLDQPESDNAARNNLRANCRKIAEGDGRELGRNFLLTNICCSSCTTMRSRSWGFRSSS